MQSNRLQILMEVAIFAVIALILDLFIPSIGPLKLTVKMIPIIIVALRRGLLPGILSGFLWGFLQFIIGDAQILTLLQFVLEYFVAFAMVGFAGIVSKPLQKTLHIEPDNVSKQILLVTSSLVLGSFLRYVIHFLAGFIFWGQYAPAGQGAVYYSFTVNGTAFISETITCIIVLVFLAASYKRLIKID